MLLLMIIFYLSPLSAVITAGLIQGWRSEAMRVPYQCAAGYILLQAMALGFVWYCYHQGYQDWLLANIFPQGLVLLGLPASWIAFIFFFPDRKTKTSDSKD